MKSRAIAVAISVAMGPRRGGGSSRFAPGAAAFAATLAATLAASFAILGGCNTDPSGGTISGPAVYQSLCASCHGSDGRPPAAMAARLGVRDLTAPEFRGRVTPELVEQQVRRGSKNKLMPAFEGAISDAQIRSVAGYVASPLFVSPR